jgi:hypothetical protein
MTELELLDREIGEACRGLVRQSRRVGERVEHALDVRRHVGNHPWIALGAALAAGLLVGGALARGAGAGLGRRLLAPLLRSAGPALGSLVQAALHGD